MNCSVAGFIGLQCGYLASTAQLVRTYRMWWHWFGSHSARLLSFMLCLLL